MRRASSRATSIGSRPGARFRTQGRTITETDLVSFAALTGDHHPLHTDAEWAAESEFNGRIAHGMLLLSYASAWCRSTPSSVLALRGFERVAFKRPVRIGDTIHVEGELESKKRARRRRRPGSSSPGRSSTSARRSSPWPRSGSSGAARPQPRRRPRAPEQVYL